MQTYEIPRDYKGEGRILFIFSTKALIYTVIGIVIGLIFYFIFKMMNLSIVGFIIMGILGLLGFSIGTFKIPESNAFKFTKLTGGENIDDIIIRWIKFKKKGNKVYIYKGWEDTKDE